MPFKIVQTIENGVTKLTIVPALWETKGIIKWPPKNFKYPSKLVKDGNSRPDTGWDSFKCVLKRTNIKTYEQANQELRHMEQNTDTDNHDIDDSFVLQGSVFDDTINFEAMAQDLEKGNAHLAKKVSCTSTANVFPQQQDTIQVFSTEHMQELMANQALILEKLNTILENQKKFAFKVASLSVQLDETSISQEIEKAYNVTLLQDCARLEESESFEIRPIENQQQMEMLEANLADKKNKTKFFKKLTLLCSSSVGTGTTCAYKVLDILFSKEFLCQCSWSGGSKGELSKIPFKIYRNITKFFFELVNSWDCSFTHDQTINFFKLVLRNATKRKAIKGLRTSTKRARKVTNCENNINYINVDNGNSEAVYETNRQVDLSKPESFDENASDHELDLC